MHLCQPKLKTRGSRILDLMLGLCFVIVLLKCNTRFVLFIYQITPIHLIYNTSPTLPIRLCGCYLVPLLDQTPIFDCFYSTITNTMGGPINLVKESTNMHFQ